MQGGMEQRHNGELVACMEQIDEEGRTCGMHGANRQARMEPVACMEQILYHFELFGMARDR